MMVWFLLNVKTYKQFKSCWSPLIIIGSTTIAMVIPVLKELELHLMK